MGTKREIRVKEYRSAKDYERDAKKMLKDGWVLQATEQREKRVDVGTTMKHALLTGGVGLLLGGRAHKEGKTMVTWVRGGEEAAKACPRCAEKVAATAQVCRFCGHDFAVKI